MNTSPGQKITIFALLISFAFFLSLTLPFEFLIKFFEDDSYFYMKTALNFASGFSSTFDKINQTNGYHPLWFLILSAYYFVINIFASPSPEFLLRATVLLHYIIFFVNIIIIYEIIVNNYKKNYWGIFFIALFLLIIQVFLRSYGLESHITILLLSIYLLIKTYEINNDKDHILAKCILFSLIFLSRIDYAFTVIPVLIVYECFFEENKFHFKKLLNFLFIVYGTLLIYVLINYLYFGHCFTISGTAKNSFPKILIFENIQQIITTKNFFKIRILLFFAFAFILTGLRILKEKDKFTKILFFAGIGMLAFDLLNLTFNYEGLRDWYLIGTSFITILLLVNIIYKYPKTQIAVLISCIIFAIFSVKSKIDNNIVNITYIEAYKYAKVLKENTRSDDRILQVDMSGTVGFFSERNIINGDGLINSFEYYNYLKQNKLGEYIKMANVNYYSTYFADTISNSVIDKLCAQRNYGGWNYIFPLNSVKIRMPVNFLTPIDVGKTEWMLIKLQN